VQTTWCSLRDQPGPPYQVIAHFRRDGQVTAVSTRTHRQRNGVDVLLGRNASLGASDRVSTSLGQQRRVDGRTYVDAGYKTSQGRKPIWRRPSQRLRKNQFCDYISTERFCRGKVTTASMIRLMSPGPMAAACGLILRLATSGSRLEPATQLIRRHGMIVRTPFSQFRVDRHMGTFVGR